MKQFKIVIFILVLLFSRDAYACLGPFYETQTFLVELPKEATDRDVVAKVRILSTEVDAKTYKKMSKVKVLDAIKGTAQDAVFIVASETHSCARDYDIKRGETYFIAGSFDKSGIFEGVWKGGYGYRKAQTPVQSGIRPPYSWPLLRWLWD